MAIKAQKKQGAPTTVDLEALLAEAGGRRAQWLRERTDRTLTDTVRKPVAAAETVADLHAALQPVIDAAATPDLVPAGALVRQPSEARRRSGSHYTPRELTEPIVRTTLEPILARLRGPSSVPPRPEAILDLKVCDPAMGSGAFLVETCRQLGDALVEAWRAHLAAPELPAGEDEVIVARRQVAQRCLYGVDRNPMAVDLAKVSLWLATLARQEPLTFVDHALRHGDSLVGLSRRQIEAFHWDASSKYSQQGFETIPVREQVAKVAELRRRIRDAGAGVTDWDLRDWWDEARFELDKVRLFGDLATAAFFEAGKPKARETRRAKYAGAVLDGRADEFRGILAERRCDDPPLAPFHWELEFPEVFEQANPGFDAIVGNPPFLGGKRISTNLGDGYRDWLATLHAESSSNADLVAHFFRRADRRRPPGGAGSAARLMLAMVVAWSRPGSSGRTARHNPAPERPTTSRQVVQVGGDVGDERLAVRAGEQLFDVPGVLGAAGEELEEDEVLCPRGRQARSAGERGLGALEEPLLPAVAAHDQVDRLLPLLLEPDDARKGVVGVAPRSRHLHARVGQRLPPRAVQRGVGQRQQVDVAGRAADAVDGQCGGADQGVRDAGAVESRGDALEQAQPMSRWMHPLGWRVAWRRRSMRRIAVRRSRPWVARNASRSSSPRRKASSRRSASGIVRTASASRRRRADATDLATDLTGRVYPRDGGLTGFDRRAPRT